MLIEAQLGEAGGTSLVPKAPEPLVSSMPERAELMLTIALYQDQLDSCL